MINQDSIKSIKIFRFESFILVYFLLSVMVYLVGNYTGGLQFVEDFLYITASLVAFITGIYAYKIYGRKNRYGITLLLLSLGILLWMIGEILWILYDHVLGIDPFPSFADVLYVYAYPLFFLAMCKYICTYHIPKAERIRKFIEIPFATLFVFLGIWIAYNLITGKGDGVATIATISYYVGDAILAGIALFALFISIRFGGGRMAKAWRALSFAFFLTFVADTLFSLFAKQYEEGTGYFYILLDILWIASYLFFAYYFYILLSLIKNVQKKAIK